MTSASDAHQSTMEVPQHRFYIDTWLVEPRLNRIVGQGGTTPVEPKVMQVLAALASQPGEVLDREHLLDLVWGDTVVSDHVLTRSISELRKIFGDDPRHPSYIETIPKTGYRLIAPVRGDGYHPSTPAPAVRSSGDSAFPPTAELAVTPSAYAFPAPASPRLDTHGRWLLGTIVLLTLALSTGLFLWTQERTPAAPLPTTLFTSFPGVEQHPVFSPDGRQIAFVRSPDPGTNRIYTKLIGSETLLALTPDSINAYRPVWSPDGRRVAYRSTSPNACGVFIVDALGGPARQVADCGLTRHSLAWAPDGSGLVIGLTDSTHGSGLALLSPETGALRHLTTDAHRDYLPVFSPDGHRLAFLRGTGLGAADLYVLDLHEASLPRRLTFDQRFIAGMAWSADASHLIFSSNRTGNFKLWQIPASGGTPTWLSSLGAYDPGEVTLSHDGRHLIYEEWLFEINVWQITPARTTDAQPDAQRPLASTRWDYQPDFSPDGQRIAFASNRSGSFEIWTADHDGEHAQRLTDFGGPFAGQPRWSPDGSRIAFNAYVDEHATLFAMNADGGHLSQLTTDDAHAMAPSWSHDGRWLYFASDRSGAWQIWKMPASGGDPIQITQDGGYRAFESADGAALYFTRQAEPGLWRKPTDGGPATRLLDAPDRAYAGTWTLTQDALYVVERTTDGPTLSRFDLATQQTTRVFNLAGRTLSHEAGLSVAPDGRLLVAFADRIESDLVLVALER